jgi:hypothetical protein
MQKSAIFKSRPQALRGLRTVTYKLMFKSDTELMQLCFTVLSMEVSH